MHGDAAPGPRRRDAPRSARRALAIAIVVLVIAGLFAAGEVRRNERGPAGRTVDELLEQTEDLRGLRVRRSIEPEFLTPAQLAAELRQAVQADEFAADLPDQRLLAALGLIPRDRDLREILADAGAASVVGFYDPLPGRLVVRSATGDLTPLAKTTLVHEMTHALTDQHFDLSRLLEARTSEDGRWAGTALVEGDATLATTLWTTRYLSIEDALASGFEAVGGVIQALPTEVTPPALAELMMFPYTDGARFVRWLYDEGGWEAVDAAYRDPPETTEQVLHPEKYRAGERPAPVRPPPGRGRVEASGTLGELFVRVWLSGGAGALLPIMSPEDHVAAGWDGAAFTVSTDAAIRYVSMATRWDTTADAREFADAVARWFDRALGPAKGGPERFAAMARCLTLRRAGVAVRVEIAERRCPL